MTENTGNVRAPLRGAIIGLGNAAVYAHLPVLQMSEDFSIDAIVEPVPERAEIGRRLLPQARIYPDMEALLSEDAVDFVDICTPPCFHAEFVLAACRSGLHVLCEKPLSVCTERLREIQQLAEQTQRVVFTVNNWKYAPLWARTTELIQENRIGAIQSISLNVLRPPDCRWGLFRLEEVYRDSAGRNSDRSWLAQSQSDSFSSAGISLFHGRKNGVFTGEQHRSRRDGRSGDAISWGGSPFASHMAGILPPQLRNHCRH